MTITSLPSNCFLSDVSVYQVDQAGELIPAIGSPIETLARQAADQGSAIVGTDNDLTHVDSSAALAIPVHRGGAVVSVVVLSAKTLRDDQDDLVGVFEVWEPVGVYEELSLKSGFFGKMDRFHNVSSFVRFEKGTGLPGQVWRQRGAVVHDDLSNHPGFLRAAGASADLLVTAVGIPVATTAYHCTAVLISSAVSPLTRGIEIWKVQPECFSLVSATYREISDSAKLLPETTIPLNDGLPGLAARTGGAAISDDPTCVFAGRNHDTEVPYGASGLAIPFFDGDDLASVATFLF